MKKQILFLAMFTLALVFASTNDVFGQLDASSSAVPPISCADPSAAGFIPQPLHPFAGVPYTYSLDGATGIELADEYTWWATKNPAFIPSVGTNNLGDALGTPQILNPGATYGVTTAAASGNEVEITWSADILAATEYQGDATGWSTASASAPTPTFVVGYATGVNCADNIQVFEINPLPNFVVDIAPIDPADNTSSLAWDDDGTTAKTCVDEVQSATYNSVDKGLDLDYGTNTIYFEVAAANFVKDWTPTFQIASGLKTTQTAVISMYSTLADATGTGTALFTSASIDADGLNTDIPSGVPLTAAIPSDATTGVSAYVKVVILNLTEESLIDNPFTLVVDAQDDGGTGIWDMEDEDCTTVTDGADLADKATITITPRPQLDDTTDDTLTDPDTYIPKN